jgi:L-ascorbate metabolism protein UlaG (beta-lactamase superfamily)
MRFAILATIILSLGMLFLPKAAQAGSSVVTITPLGAGDGDFCRDDRALLFEDPTGVRVLTAPGRTVKGSGDPRIAPLGFVHVVLIDHPHVDHIGDRISTNCAGTTTQNLAFPSQGNAPEIAARHNAAILVGGEMASFFTQKILDITGATPAGCPAAGLDNTMEVPRTSPCVATIRGGTRSVAMAGGSPGVKITTILAFHGAGASATFVDSPGVPPGLTGYMGTETGYVIRFTNGLTVLWTGDSGLIGDWATQSDFYKVNLAVVHIDGLNVMGPDEAAYAVNKLIKPRTVIPEHANQVSTTGGKVNPGTVVEKFMRQVISAKVILPLSGVKIICDGQGNCKQD